MRIRKLFLNFCIAIAIVTPTSDGHKIRIFLMDTLPHLHHNWERNHRLLGRCVMILQELKYPVDGGIILIIVVPGLRVFVHFHDLVVVG